MMADPARIKVDSGSERSTEEKTDVKTEPEDAAPAAKSTDENKEPSSQQQPKQEQKSVSVYHKLPVILVGHIPYISQHH